MRSQKGKTPIVASCRVISYKQVILYIYTHQEIGKGIPALFQFRIFEQFFIFKRKMTVITVSLFQNALLVFINTKYHKENT